MAFGLYLSGGLKPGRKLFQPPIPNSSRPGPETGTQIVSAAHPKLIASVSTLPRTASSSPGFSSGGTIDGRCIRPTSRACRLRSWNST